MHVIMGLPRSGSTLLCNILAQNPAFSVEHTNMLPGIIQTMIQMWSQNPDIRGGLNRDLEGTTDRIDRCAKAICEAWHNEPEKVVFNKSRGWAHNLLALRRIYPNSKVLVTIRDPREVFASFERQHQKNPLFDLAGNSFQKMLATRAQNMFSAQGMIGSTLLGVQDILDRKQDVYFIKYEDFVRHPAQMMERIYCYLDQPAFEHDFENVVNTATDPDYLYLNKYPHDGSGKVEPRPPSWPKVMDEPIAQSIVRGYLWFFEHFKYVNRETPRARNSQQPKELPLRQRLRHPDSR